LLIKSIQILLNIEKKN